MNRSGFAAPSERERQTSECGPSDPAAIGRSGSDLCLPCGLCCDGSWFDRALLKRDDVTLARELGLDVAPPGNGNLSFRLPCPHHLSGRCAIYHRCRPAICSNYKCRLLCRYEQGEVTLEESMRPIQKAKELIELFEMQSGAGQGFRAEICRTLNAPDTLLTIDANARIGMIAAALFALYRRHFEVKIEPLDPNELDVSSDHSASAM